MAVVVADAHVEIVEQSRVHVQPDELEALLLVQTAREQLVHGEADADDEPPPGALAHPLEHLQAEPRPIRRGTAIGVVAAVDQG